MPEEIRPTRATRRVLLAGEGAEVAGELRVEKMISEEMETRS